MLIQIRAGINQTDSIIKAVPFLVTSLILTWFSTACFALSNSKWDFIFIWDLNQLENTGNVGVQKKLAKHDTRNVTSIPDFWGGNFSRNALFRHFTRYEMLLCKAQSCNQFNNFALWLLLSLPDYDFYCKSKQALALLLLLYTSRIFKPWIKCQFDFVNLMSR